MAEQVQAVLDGMVTPLRDLMDRGIFSESEIRSIVSRRRESEYLLRRRAARKADFLIYIEAESSLEKLRAVRTRQVVARQKRAEQHERNKPHKGTENTQKKKKDASSDAHVVQHMHFLYTRVLRKFRGDVSLHLQHAAFAKETKSYTRLGKIYAEALQFHPRNVGLWIEAASHEFFGNFDEQLQERVGGGSLQSARVLLQRGLRINGASSQDLWLQYFSLEFHHIQKMRGRRAIMMEGNERKEDQSYDSDPLSKEATIPNVVYKNAIKTIPDNVTFRLKFLDLCRQFPETESVESHIMSSIEKDFHDKPEAWIARATYAAEQERMKQQENMGDGDATGFTRGASDAGTHSDEETALSIPRKKRKRNDGAIGSTDSNSVLDILEEATDQLCTPEMYLESIHLVRSYIESLIEAERCDDKQIEVISENIAECNAFVEKLLYKAHDVELKSPQLVIEHANYLVAKSEIGKAVQVLERFVTENVHVTNYVAVWIHLARLNEQCQPQRSGIQILRAALNRIPMHDQGHKIILLELFDDLLSSQQQTASSPLDEDLKCKRELSDLFQRVLLLTPGEEYKVAVANDEGAASHLAPRSVADACLQYLRFSFQDGGILDARKVYTAVLQSNYVQSAAGKTQGDLVALKDFFDECILLEKNGKQKGKGKSWNETKSHLRRLYDSTISYFRDADSPLADTYRQGRDRDVTFAR